MSTTRWAKAGLLVYVAAILAVFLMGDCRRGFGTFWVIVAAVATTLFVFAYGRFCEWKRHPNGTPNLAGQHLMWFARADVLILWYLVGAQYLIFPAEWYTYSRALTYLTLAALMIWRLGLLVAIQVTARREREEASNGRH